MKLYEISNDLRQLLEVEDEAYTDTLEALNMEFDEKADSVACYIKELQAEAEAIKEEERKLQERRKAKENKVESLKAYLLHEMQVAGKKKVETARNVLSIRKTAPSVKIQDEDKLINMINKSEALKKQFTVQKEPMINKLAIKEFIKNGGFIEGVTLEAGESFNIK